MAFTLMFETPKFLLRCLTKLA